MPPTFYLLPVESVGYALDDTGNGSNFNQLYAASYGGLRAAAVARDNPDSVYAFNFSGDRAARSTDAGNTWTILGTVPWTPSNECVPYMLCHAAGDVHVWQDGSTAADNGIWRSTDAGSTWTHIVPGVANGYMTAGTNRIWFADRIDYITYAIKSCNWDGSGLTVHANTDWTNPYGGAQPSQLKLRALDDTFCLAGGGGYMNRMYKITSAGVVTDISPSFVAGGTGGYGAAWDMVMFDANTYVAARPPHSPDSLAVQVYRTTSGGMSWSLVQTLSITQGFASLGYSPLMLMDGNYMYGYADSTTRAFIWKTSDAGATWTAIRNLAALTDAASHFRDQTYGSLVARGVAPPPAVAVPSRLATIVG